jgi:molybdopterin-guanine dinucleotide biosynthesis protein A
MPERERITGLILAGGRGTRMGSVDKGLQLLGGRPLFERTLDRLEPQVGPILISANRHRDRYAASGHRVVEDRVDDHAGPLAGLQAGLAACETAFLAAVPCDAPFFRTIVGSDLDAFLDAGGRSVNAWVDRLRARKVSFADEASFRNLNSIDDLRLAESEVGQPR